MPAARPTQAKITRSVKGAIAGGMDVGAVEITADGTIRILPRLDPPPESAQAAQDGPGSW